MRLKIKLIEMSFFFVLFCQVKSGTIFDNFQITDDIKEAEDFATETWGATKVGRGWDEFNRPAHLPSAQSSTNHSLSLSTHSPLQEPEKKMKQDQDEVKRKEEDEKTKEQDAEAEDEADNDIDDDGDDEDKEEDDDDDDDGPSEGDEDEALAKDEL